MTDTSAGYNRSSSLEDTQGSDDPLAVYMDVDPETPRPRPIQYYSNGKRIPRSPAKIKLPLLLTSVSRYHTSDTSGSENFNAWWKVNMWQRPIQVHLLYLLAWFILGLLGYYFLVVRFFSGPMRICFTAIPGGFALLAFLVALYTGSVDTEDPRVPAADLERNIRFKKVLGVPVINRATQYCNICQVKVDETTKHCKPCNKCVEGFDHHCDFLGQDIGRKNYWSFFVALVFGWLLAFWATAIALYSFTLYFYRSEQFNSTGSLTTPHGLFMLQVADIFNDHHGTSKVVAAVLFVYACIMFGAGTAGFALTLFHCKLLYLGMSTWRFIELEQQYECGAGPDPWKMRSQRRAKPEAQSMSRITEV